MKTKFKYSNTQISGEIVILDNGLPIVIPLTGSKGTTKSGIYEIVNIFNGKRYIGQARNLEIRMKRHWNDLKKGIHHASKEMKDDFQSIKTDNPEDVFDFKVIKYCRPSELTFYEHLLIKHLNPEYNVKKEKTLIIGGDNVIYEIEDKVLNDNIYGL